MKAIILAAGQGKRLHPMTKNIPKCMVKLFGKSLLEWQLETYRSCSITDISVVVGYCSDVINFPNVNYYNNKKFETTNMVETLFCAKEKLMGSVIVSYGDIIFEKKLLEKLINSNENFSVVVDKSWEKYWKIRFDNPLEDAESLVLDKDGYIQNIGKKVENINEIEGQYIGLMKFQKSGLDYLKEFYEKMKNSIEFGINPLNPSIPFEKSYMTDFLQGLINAECKLKSVPVENGWLELDTLHDYEIYEKMNKVGTLKQFFSLGESN